MILSCPACNTRFSVPDNAFTGSSSRRLRCARCQHVWYSGSEGEADPQALDGHQAFAAMLAAAGATATYPAFSPPPVVSENFRQTLDRAARSWPRLPKRLAWFISLILLFLTLMTGYLGREVLAARFAFLETFYITLGMMSPPPVENFDLLLQKAEKCLISGRDMLCLSGQVVNRSGKARKPPTIYITALNHAGEEFTDADGRVLLTWRVEDSGSKLSPGEARDFALTEPYPDKAIADFDYGFIND